MKRIALLVAVGLVTVCACSSHPTAGEAVDKFVPALCSRMKTCLGASFDEPGCEKVLKNSVPASDRDKIDACTNDELDTCLKDIETMQCPSSSVSLTSALPASCQKC